MAQQEAQLAAAREAEAQAARDREAAEERQRARAEALQRRREREKAQPHQRSQETRGGRTGRGPRSSSTARFEYAGEAAAPPPPKAVLGDVLALAVDKHEGRNARSASELASAEDSREELEVRRAIAESIVLNSSLRVDAPVFVPAARAFTGAPP